MVVWFFGVTKGREINMDSNSSQHAHYFGTPMLHLDIDLAVSLISAFLT